MLGLQLSDSVRACVVVAPPVTPPRHVRSDTPSPHGAEGPRPSARQTGACRGAIGRAERGRRCEAAGVPCHFSTSARRQRPRCADVYWIPILGSHFNGLAVASRGWPVRGSEARSSPLQLQAPPGGAATRRGIAPRRPKSLGSALPLQRSRSASHCRPRPSH